MGGKGGGFDDVETALGPPPPGYAAAAPARRRVDLRWSDAGGPHLGTVDARAIVGSAPDAAVVVADPAVSRLHAEIEVRDDGVWIKDLASKNGTFVEGVQVALARLPDRAQVRVGSTVILAERAATATPVEVWRAERFGPMIGRSTAMRELFARLARVAPTASTVLIHGETGTGKELVARAIHEASPRAGEPFVIVDCAALPENVLEAELFGHAKGAFTGATSARAGAIEAADKGTVFLDEIGELPLSVQPKLLRVLESRAVRRLGESSYRGVDVRFLSATHRDLHTMVNAGAFREDLFFRLAVLPVTVPPLRERPDDIPALVEHLAKGATTALGPEIVRELTTRPWLGNVRELRNFVERALAFGAREALAMTSGGGAPSQPRMQTGLHGQVAGALEGSLAMPLREAREAWMDALEREYLQRLLQAHGRNVNAVAEAAGVARTYVYRLIRKHDL